jgi:hypothetical protein
VIEVESQAVLNTLRDPDIQEAFRKGQKRWKLCIRVEWGYFEYDGGLWPHGSTSPGNHGWLLLDIDKVHCLTLPTSLDLCCVNWLKMLQ